MPHNQQHTITVFGSGHPSGGHPDYEQVRLLGAELARRGFRVCTGGYGGVMEAALRGAKEAGGRTLGVTTKGFRGTANAWVDEERSMEDWQARLFELIRAGDGYAVCKGGTGTLAELAVVWEMLNKGVIAGKPLVALGEFWAPVVRRVIEGEADHSASKREREADERTQRSQAARRHVHWAADAREAAELIAQSLETKLKMGPQGGARVAPR